MDFGADESSINETIDAFLNAVGTSDLAMLDALPLLDLLDDASDVEAEIDDDEDEGGSEEGMNVVPYTDSDDEEMAFGHCRGDCHSHFEDFYTTCSSRAINADPKMSSVGSSLRSDNPLTMDSDEEEEVDHHQDQLKASREMFAEWRDLEDRELDEYLGNGRHVKEQKQQVAEIKSDNSDVDIEGISDASSDNSSDVDIENVNPDLFTEIRDDINKRSTGSNVLGNSISLNFHNYAMCPQSVFRFTGKPSYVSTMTGQPSTSKFVPLTASSEKPSTSGQKLALASLRITSSTKEKNIPSISTLNKTSLKQSKDLASKSLQRNTTSSQAPPSSFRTSSQAPSTSSFMASSQAPSTSSFMTSSQAPPTSSFMASSQAPSTSSFVTSSQAQSRSALKTSSTSTQIPHAPAKRGRPSTTGGAARRGRPPLSSNAGRRRSAMLVAAAIRRPAVVTEAVRNVRDFVTSINVEDFPARAVRKQDRLNMMERSRRRKLSDLQEELRLQVPSLAELDKASKAQIMNSAIAYIIELQDMERSQNVEISTEMNRLQLLLQELNKLRSHK